MLDCDDRRTIGLQYSSGVTKHIKINDTIRAEVFVCTYDYRIVTYSYVRLLNQSIFYK